MLCWPRIVVNQYSTTNEMHLWYSVYYELTASTCSEHYLLIFRRRYTNNWYIACVLCLLAATRIGVELLIHNKLNTKRASRLFYYTDTAYILGSHFIITPNRLGSTSCFYFLPIFYQNSVCRHTGQVTTRYMIYQPSVCVFK
jgi:hypothetical protein